MALEDLREQTTRFGLGGKGRAEPVSVIMRRADDRFSVNDRCETERTLEKICWIARPFITTAEATNLDMIACHRKMDVFCTKPVSLRHGSNEKGDTVCRMARCVNLGNDSPGVKLNKWCLASVVQKCLPKGKAGPTGTVTIATGLIDQIGDQLGKHGVAMSLVRMGVGIENTNHSAALTSDQEFDPVSQGLNWIDDHTGLAGLVKEDPRALVLVF